MFWLTVQYELHAADLLEGVDAAIDEMVGRVAVEGGTLIACEPMLRDLRYEFESLDDAVEARLRLIDNDYHATIREK